VLLNNWRPFAAASVGAIQFPAAWYPQKCHAGPRGGDGRLYRPSPDDPIVMRLTRIPTSRACPNMTRAARAAPVAGLPGMAPLKRASPI
jgi:hypothetical protein